MIVLWTREKEKRRKKFHKYKKINWCIEKNNEVLSEKLLIVDCMLIRCLFVIRTPITHTHHSLLISIFVCIIICAIFMKLPTNPYQFSFIEVFFFLCFFFYFIVFAAANPWRTLLRDGILSTVRNDITKKVLRLVIIKL